MQIILCITNLKKAFFKLLKIFTYIQILYEMYYIIDFIFESLNQGFEKFS